MPSTGGPGGVGHSEDGKGGKYSAGGAGPGVHSYLVAHSVRSNTHLDALQKATLEHPRSGMASPPDSLAVMQLLLRLVGARRVIEVGVFTGYMTLGMALGLPEDGEVMALDLDANCASVGQPFWKAAGVDGKIRLRVGSAAQSLDDMLEAGEEGSYDLGFIDADKVSYGVYYEQLLRLVRRGGLVVVDNVLWGGRVANPAATDPDTVAIRQLNDKIFQDDRVQMCMLTNSDGITVALKL